MPRPNKLNVPYTTYNLVIPIKMKEQLSKIAHDRSVIENQQISIADIIRESVNERLS
ncbi:hypothetical protein [uncultured Mediterranean phage uvMED]|nr:hypothetical protein [uncultured Mediterranean phage uvMED]